MENKDIPYRYFVHPASMAEYEDFRTKFGLASRCDERIFVHPLNEGDNLLIWETTIYNPNSDKHRLEYVGAFSDACYAQRINNDRAAWSEHNQSVPAAAQHEQPGRFLALCF